MTPVVFVHGFMGGSQQWHGQIGALGTAQLVTVDLPGFGENAHRPALPSIADMAAWALTQLSAMGHARFHLVGHSMGGMVAQEMIAQAPDRVERLVLYGTGAVGVLPGRFESIETSKMRARADGPRATARRIAETWFLHGAQGLGFEGCAAIAEATSLEAMMTGLDAMHTWDGRAHLASITAPTLVLWGDQDRTYTWHQIEQLWTTIPDASLAVIPGCAHAPHLERPELFNPIVSAFLAQI